MNASVPCLIVAAHQARERGIVFFFCVGVERGRDAVRRKQNNLLLISGSMREWLFVHGIFVRSFFVHKLIVIDKATSINN